jgi:ABC-type nitrate/sulfonate/bicarbonate transport system ATPase subunit
LGLELIGLSKEFGDETTGKAVKVLNDLHYRVEEGHFVSVVGPSGCGKTTLLKVIAGLEGTTAGRVLLDGRDVDYGRDRIGLVFQEYALFPWRTTIQNIQTGLEIMGVERRQRLEAAMEYVRSFGLEGFENRYPRELSGGMQQRVAIARTLITSPRVVLMDEPFGSLDSQTRNEMQEFLLRLWQERGETIIFVTHNVDEAVFLSDHIVALSSRPASIIGSFEVPCPRPRDRTSLECNEIRRAVLKSLKDKALGENGITREAAC